MSPQRELGGAQSPAGKPKRFNVIGYFLILLLGSLCRKGFFNGKPSCLEFECYFSSGNVR